MNAVLNRDETAMERKQPGNSLYSVVPEDLWHPDFGEYRTYGIKVTTLDYACVVHDVSIVESEVTALVDRMNRYRLSPIHLYDAVTDNLF